MKRAGFDVFCRLESLFSIKDLFICKYLGLIVILYGYPIIIEIKCVNKMFGGIIEYVQSGAETQQTRYVAQTT